VRARAGIVAARTILKRVPEGDTIHYHANQIRPVLEGRVPDSIETLHRRFSRDRWAERLQGQAVTSVDAHGKHLFIRFENGLVIHSHLRMSGKWRVRDADYPIPRNTWLLIRTPEKVVAQLNGPVLELMTNSRTRLDQRIAGLGPDILAPELDEDTFLRRLRTDDPTRTIGDALLDQRILAGIGNLWKCEGCFDARIDPWRRVGDVSDAEALEIVHAARPKMQQSALDGMQDRWRVVYGIAGQPCPRCGTRSNIRSRGQGDDNRTTYWCPRCQR
jgi:endonuclease-8